MLRRIVVGHAVIEADRIGEHCERLHLTTGTGLELDIVVSGDGRAIDVFRDGVELSPPGVTFATLDSSTTQCYN